MKGNMALILGELRRCRAHPHTPMPCAECAGARQACGSEKGSKGKANFDQVSTDAAEAQRNADACVASAVQATITHWGRQKNQRAAGITPIG